MRKHPIVLTLAASLLMSACDRGPDETTMGGKASVSEHPAAPDSQPAATQAPEGSGAAPLLQVSAGSPSYLTDAAGASVYYLHDNRDGRRCDADCEHAWPPLLSSGGSVPPVSGVNPGLLGSLQRGDGSHQVTYAGQPLYRYAGDNGAGRTSGHNVRDKWGHWQLITPLGEPLEATLETNRPAVQDSGAPAQDGERDAATRQ